MLAWITQEAREAEALYAEAREFARRCDNPWMEPACLMNMADLMVDLGRDKRGREYLEKCVQGFRVLGDRWGIAWSILLFATVKHRTGDHNHVADMLAESTRLFHELKFKVGIRLVVVAQARIEFVDGRYENASLLFEESLSLARDMGLVTAKAAAVCFCIQSYLLFVAKQTS